MAIDGYVRAAKAEDWETVDRLKRTLAQESGNVKWATSNGMFDPDGNVRDAAASLLQVTKTLDAVQMGLLLTSMRSDDNRFVRYRAAFGLREHDPAYHAREVKKVLLEAAQHPDTEQEAKSYLTKR